MATNIEQIIMRMGFDATEVDQGLLRMQARNEVEAAKTKAIWADADRAMATEHKAMLDKELANEKEFNDTLLSLQKKQLDARVAANKVAMQEIAAQNLANQEMAMGSGGQSWRGVKRDEQGRPTGVQGGGNVEMTGGMAAQSLAHGDVHGAADTVISGAEFTGGATLTGAALQGAKKAISHGALREMMVLLHEALMGSFRRMLSSFTILLSKMGFDGIIAGALRVLGPVGAAIGGAAAGGWLSRTFGGSSMKWGSLLHGRLDANYTNDEVDSLTRGDESKEILRKRLAKMIEGAVNTGQMTTEQGQFLAGNLGNFAGIQRVQKVLGASGIEFDEKKFRDAEERKKKIADLDARAAALSETSTDKQLGLSKQINAEFQERIAITQQMAALDHDSVEYHEKNLELAKKDADIREHQAQLQKETLELQKQYDDLGRRRSRVLSEFNSVDTADVIPTIADLAGSAFTKGLDAEFKSKMDDGEGPFAAIAQQALIAKDQEALDIKNGNAQWQFNPASNKMDLVGGAAYQERQIRMSYENMLSAAGLDTPAMMQDKMNQDLSAMRADISALLAAASRDGIVLKDQ